MLNNSIHNTELLRILVTLCYQVAMDKLFLSRKIRKLTLKLSAEALLRKSRKRLEKKLRNVDSEL